jgi:hypothetical protein
MGWINVLMDNYENVNELALVKELAKVKELAR